MRTLTPPPVEDDRTERWSSTPAGRSRPARSHPGRATGAPAWRPAFRARIWVKLAAIAVVFAIPLATTTWFLLQEKAIKIDFARNELRGDDYLRAASSLLEATVNYRSALRGGDGARPDGAAAKRQEEGVPSAMVLAIALGVMT